MPSKAAALWAHYVVLDSDSKPLAGDLTVVNGVSSTHTLGWSKDGTKAACENNLVSASHLEVGNGLYKILLTTTETDCDCGGIYGTTAGGVIVPVSYTFEYGIEGVDVAKVGGTVQSGVDLGEVVSSILPFMQHLGVLVVSGTGTAADGTYRLAGTYDAYPFWANDDDTYFLYRVAVGLVWILCEDITNSPTNFWALDTSYTLGTYIGCGSRVGTAAKVTPAGGGRCNPYILIP